MTKNLKAWWHSKRLVSGKSLVFCRKAACSLVELQALPELLQALDSSNRHARLAVVEALRRFDDPRAIQALIGTTSDKVPSVRANVVLALGQKRALPALPAIIKLASDNEAIVRAAAVSALANLGGPAVVTPITEALRDDDGKVRAAAAAAIRKVVPANVLNSN